MNIHREITPLKKEDVFVVLDSSCNGFDYPIHNHPEYELNLIVGMSGTRIVGDSTERYNDCDLVLLGPYLYHKWDGDQHLQDMGQPYRVVTIQFSMDLFSGQMFQKERFTKIRQLLKNASLGLKFYGKTIEASRQLIFELAEDKGFSSIINFFQLLDLLSVSSEVSFLVSEGFSPQAPRTHSDRIRIAYGYILHHFTDPNLKIGDVAEKVNMSESAFSHFFKKYAFRSFTQFLIDVRIGHACKLLLDTEDTVSQICINSGFNNIANFNRLFKKYRSCTPVHYRKRYLEKSNFDWSTQVTPWQFVPESSTINEDIKPRAYSTKVLHY